MPIYVGDQAIQRFIDFCREKGFKQYYLIADQNTFGVLGARVLAALQEQGWDVLSQVLNPAGLHTNDFSLTRVLADYDAQPRLFVAVGSGTITDIARFTSHRSRNPFVSFPTAASVDAYTSKNSPATVGGLKGSIYCQAPIAIFTDIATICESPRFLTASGFGDSISKFTSATDWKFTQLIWGSAFDEDIYQHALHAARQSAGALESISRSDPDGMARLMDSQFESGFCMADFANSAPASGGEHHIAHLWEMIYHWQGRDGLYHGNAVGVATLIEAAWFEKLRALSREQAKTLLQKAAVPARGAQIEAIERNVPLIAAELIKGNPIYLQLADHAVLQRCRARMLEQWDALQAAAADVPPAEEIRAWLLKLGAPTTPRELNITEEQVQLAKDYGLYLRERFSMNIIRKLFGWE